MSSTINKYVNCLFQLQWLIMLPTYKMPRGAPGCQCLSLWRFKDDAQVLGLCRLGDVLMKVMRLREQRSAADVYPVPIHTSSALVDL